MTRPDVTRVVDGRVEVLTLAQWIDAYMTYLVAKYPDETKAECRSTAEAHASEWRTAVVQAYNDGAHIPTRLLRALDAGMLYRLGRTHRALASDVELRDLSKRLGRPLISTPQGASA